MSVHTKGTQEGLDMLGIGRYLTEKDLDKLDRLRDEAPALEQRDVWPWIFEGVSQLRNQPEGENPDGTTST